MLAKQSCHTFSLSIGVCWWLQTKSIRTLSGILSSNGIAVDVHELIHYGKSSLNNIWWTWRGWYHVGSLFLAFLISLFKSVWMSLSLFCNAINMFFWWIFLFFFQVYTYWGSIWSSLCRTWTALESDGMSLYCFKLIIYVELLGESNTIFVGFFWGKGRRKW